MNRFVIIDGNSLVYRAYYALPTSIRAAGKPANALYGFVSMILKLLDTLQPSHLAIAFDLEEGSFRNDMDETYKAQRDPMPEDLALQLPPLYDLVEAMGLSWYGDPHYEADDVIATLVRRLEKSAFGVVVVTGDRDLFQLVSAQVQIAMPQRGLSRFDVYDVQGVRDKMGVGPERVVDLKSLMGDASDNIPGVPGIGQKTAAHLVQEYGTLDDILGSASAIGGKLGQRLSMHADAAQRSRDLVRLHSDVPVPFDVHECSVPPTFAAGAEKLQQLGLETLSKRVRDAR